MNNPPWFGSRRRSVALFGLLALTGVLFVPTNARAATTCTFDPADHVVTVSGDADVVIVRNGDQLETAPSPGGPTTPCLDTGATVAATVQNTDLIKVSLMSPAFLGLDLSGGPLRPGFTNELGASDEIEISMHFGRLLLRGTAGPDRIVLGREGINLNAGETDDDLDVSQVFMVPEIDGYLGNDLITTRGGSATGEGIDPKISLFGGDGNDTLEVKHELVEGDGLIPVGPQLTAEGGEDDDRIEGSSLADEIDGGPGNDYIDGGAGEDDVDGEDGNNTIAFKLENVPVEVRLHSNLALFDDFSEAIPGFSNAVGSNRDDRLEGDAAINELEGGRGSDTVVGMGGIDVMAGQGGPDVFHAAAENESFSGGPGSDTVTYFSTVMDEINLVAGQATSIGGGDSFSSVENVSADGPVTVVGTAGSNRIQVSGGANIFAGGAADLILTDSAVDTVRGEGGADSIRAGAGGGPQRGGPGNDEFTSSSSADEFFGGPGRDRVLYEMNPSPLSIDLRVDGPQPTGGGNDVLDGIEDIVGSLFADTLIGDASRNTLNGFFGDDTIRTGGGNDIAIGFHGDDDLFGGPGRDAVSFSSAAGGVVLDLAASGRQDTNVGWDLVDQFENAVGSAFDDVVNGDGRANTLSGGGGDDRLLGRSGPDRLLGQSGNDDLFGGPGADVCNGGPGADTTDSC